MRIKCQFVISQQDDLFGFISKAEYDETGPVIVNRKCF